ncbi:MAG TPA: hypothetical protein VFC78_12960 [Tepidisphaeraceae bacterium]|nr:hypothetical protein [Tepidisphaeraceae bacterium]
MDVSTASVNPDSTQRVEASTPDCADVSNEATAAAPPALAPALVAPRFSLWRGFLAGLATSGSAFLILCCVLAVGGMLGPGQPILNRSIAILSLLAGVIVGVRVFRQHRIARAAPGALCGDCGHELPVGEGRCLRCGNVAT